MVDWIVSSKKYVRILILDNCECDPIWIYWNTLYKRKEKKIWIQGHGGCVIMVSEWYSHKPKTCRIANNHRKLGNRPGIVSPSEPPDGTNSVNNLILNFWLLKLWENKFLLFQATQFVVCCYGSPRKSIYPPYPCSCARHMATQNKTMFSSFSHS